ncbi:MAG: phospholipase [Rhodothermales bacterium]|nr:phospholipase [Rhodothermales bacterium]
MTSLPHSNGAIRRAGPPVEDAAAVAIVLHGRGASAESILDLGLAFDLDDLALLAPQADGHTWYPFSFLAPLDHNEPYLTGALARIDHLFQEVLSRGIPAERIALIGFSQGACLSLEYTARSAHHPGAVVALSGGLIGNGHVTGSAPPEDKTFDYEGDLSGCRVFLGCSDVDAHIPLARVQRSAAVLSGLGAEVDARIYPGMGHTVNADELTAGRAVLAALRPSR